MRAFNSFFLNIQTIVENIQPNELYKEVSDSISTNSKIDTFNQLQMSEILKKINEMKTIESSVEGITVFEAVVEEYLHIINYSLENGNFLINWKKSMIVPIEKVPLYEKLLEVYVNDDEL